MLILVKLYLISIKSQYFKNIFFKILNKQNLCLKSDILIKIYIVCFFQFMILIIYYIIKILYFKNIITKKSTEKSADFIIVILKSY